MNEFSKRVIGNWGERGSRWLQALPALVNACATQWQLTDIQPLTTLSYNYVVRATRRTDLSSVIVKIGCDLHDQECEMDALRFYDGKGSVRLFDCDREKGALLLEDIRPGITLKSFFPHDDEKAVKYTVEIIKQLHATAPREHENFQPVAKLLESLYNAYSEQLPLALVKKARELSEFLVASQTKQVLIHGDLHHDNILLSGTETWTAIDPYGVKGDPAYDVGTYMRNPYRELAAHSDISAILSRRLELFSSLLSIDMRRIKQWSFVQAVLAACWSIEGNQPPEPKIIIARALDKL